MYLCATRIEFASFYHFSIAFLELFKQCAMLHFILLTYSIYFSYAIFLTDY